MKKNVVFFSVMALFALNNEVRAWSVFCEGESPDGKKYISQCLKLTGVRNEKFPLTEGEQVCYLNWGVKLGLTNAETENYNKFASANEIPTMEGCLREQKDAVQRASSTMKFIKEEKVSGLVTKVFQDPKAKDRRPPRGEPSAVGREIKCVAIESRFPKLVPVGTKLSYYPEGQTLVSKDDSGKIKSQDKCEVFAAPEDYVTLACGTSDDSDRYFFSEKQMKLVLEDIAVFTCKN